MIRLWVLGSIRLCDDGGAPLERVLAGDHRTALLGYLALAWPGSRRRESIMALLWPDQEVAQARHSLRQLLHVLRVELGEGVITATGDEFVGVDGGALWCDAVAFRRAVHAAEYERALELYDGPFCAGLSLPGAAEFDRWLERTRRELHEAAADSARLLALRCDAKGRPADALHWGRRALLLAPPLTAKP